jgi:diguanylate cyclase (GGDEF)-like protein/PAS domain S-box-containing protein
MTSGGATTVAADHDPDLPAFGSRLVHASPDAMVVIQDGRHVFANDRALKLYRATSLEQLAARPAIEYMDPAIAREARARMHAMTHQRRSLDYVEEAIIRLDGTRCEIEVAGSPIEFNGKPAALVVIRDITGRNAARRARRAAEQRFHSAFVHAPVGMAVLDGAGVLCEVNPALASILRRPDHELIGRRAWQWIHPEERPAARARFHRLRSGVSTVENSEFRVVRPDGGLAWVQASTSVLRDEADAPTSFIVQLQDVTARRSAEEQLKSQASRDGLTGLANRAMFTLRLNSALATKEPDNSRPAVLFLDLDRFKVVNDSMGHGSGDELLMQVAGRLLSAVRPGDTVARLGGDEFAILLNHVRSVDEAALAARRLQQSLAEPFAIDGADVYANASIGIALAEPGTDASTLLRDADAAMYRAKAAGGGSFVTFDEQLRADCSRRMDLENGLYGALARDELFLVYQPVVRLDTGEMVGVEALLRWRRADGSVISPEEFIPVAEETGLIVGIGAWAVREACRQLRHWRTIHPALPEMSMAVNVSSRQVLTPELCDEVLSLMEQISPDRLTLEITETAAAQITDSALHNLERLSAHGVQFAIDDFGTGQSTLARLRTLPVHLLKIDRQFTAELAASEEDKSIVLAMIAMATALGMLAVAEGVETAEQAEILREAGCPLAQGYLFGRPCAPEDILFRLGRRAGGRTTPPGRRRRPTTHRSVTR